MIGQTFSQYKIVDKIGEGGMGVVYKAHDEELDRYVALKFLPAHLMGDEDRRKRFMQEAKAVSSLDHPNVCTIYEVGKTPKGRVFISMAYYEGVTLKTAMGRERLSLESALRYAVQIARGLSRAHAASVAHRDIKPANIIVTIHDDVRILDFGIAKLAHATGLTDTGTTMGTVSYMSPEQARGTKVDHRTDIWSLGVMMYEMIAGERPFRGEFEQAIIYSILNEEPKRLSKVVPDIPDVVEHIVKKAMEKDMNKRYATMEDLLAELEPIKREVAGESPLSGTRTRPFTARRRKRVWMSSLFAVIPVAAIAFYMMFPRQPSIDPRLAAIAARDSTRVAERTALVSGAQEWSRAEFSEADALMVRAQVAFDADQFDQAVTLFDRATKKFAEAREAAGQRAAAAEAAKPEQPVTSPPKPRVKPREAQPVKKVAAVTDRSGDVSRERRAMQEAKLLTREAQADEFAKDILAAAVERENAAERLVASARYDDAIAQFGEARDLYRAAADHARPLAEEARQRAHALQGRVDQKRSSLPADFEFLNEYRDGVALEREGDSEMKQQRYSSAIDKYEAALAGYDAATASRERQISDIKNIVHKYRRALEAEDLRAMESLYSSLSPEVRSDWAGFFKSVSNLTAQIEVDEIEFNEQGATTHLSMRLSYSGARGSGEVNRWEMVMRQKDGSWFIIDVRRKS